MRGNPPADDAFAAFVAETRGPLRRTAFLVCGDWHRAEDVVQAVHVRMHARWARIGEVSDVVAYARRAVVNAAVDERRRPWRREHSTRDLPDVAAAEPTEPHRDLVAALDGLARRQRAVLVLRFVEDRSVAETADLLGISEGTVKSQSAKGLAVLRRRLGNAGAAAAPPTPTATVRPIRPAREER